jgi:dienelactone hydrolase
MTLLGRPYAKREFTNTKITRTVYERGNGPPVIVMHELPGLAEPTVLLADDLVARGYTAILPHLFGSILAEPHNHVVASIETDVVSVANLAFLCMRNEFAKLRGGKSAPITNGLRALAKDASTKHEGGKVGAIGMCLTGGYVIAMMIDPWLAAPVTAQPAIPLPKGLHADKKASQLSVSDEELAAASARAKADDLPLLAFRFSSDSLCPAARFQRLKDAFDDKLDAQVITTPDPVHRLNDDAHSVLTYEFEKADPADAEHPSRKARARLMSFLAERLPVA